MIRIISSAQEWTSLLSTVQSYDYYHTYEYTVLECSRQAAEPLFVSYTSGGNIILLPLLLRLIPNTPYFDATSAYGYPGPLCKYIDSTHIHTFSRELKAYFLDNNIVSVFSRMNPVLKNTKCFDSIGDIDIVSKTISVDLVGTEEEQVSRYRKGHRYSIKKNHQLVCRFADWSDQSDTFIEIYYQTMGRLSANDQYYFDKEYLDKFFHTKTYLPLLVICELNNQAIGAAIFVGCQGILQYHLSGSRTEYTKYSPSLIMVDYVRRWGSENGYDELHLGGGYSSSDDSLFRFKSGFSDVINSFSIWKYIVSPQIYLELCRERGIDPQTTSFFPAYRSPPLLAVEAPDSIQDVK